MLLPIIPPPVLKRSPNCQTPEWEFQKLKDLNILTLNTTTK